MSTLPELAQHLAHISTELATPKSPRTAGAISQKSTLSNAIFEYLLAVGERLTEWGVKGKVENDSGEQVNVSFVWGKTPYFINLRVSPSGIHVYASTASQAPLQLDKDLATYELGKLIQSDWDADKLGLEISGLFEDFMREVEDDR